MKSLDERLALMTLEGRQREYIKTAYIAAFSDSLPEDQQSAIGVVCMALAHILNPSIVTELFEIAGKADQ